MQSRLFEFFRVFLRPTEQMKNVFSTCYNIAVWFKEKNRAAILNADVSESTKGLIRDAKRRANCQLFR
jgi:hypothetical protein